MPNPPQRIDGPTSHSPGIVLARLGPVTQGQSGVSDSAWINVHFNPASLQLQLSNELKDADRDHPAQYIAKTTAKLSMELQFDCTDSGQNVVQTTRKLQVFLAPQSGDGQSAQQQPAPPLVLFEWGAFTFKGIVETYTETTDFFSADGVPLRSLVKLTLKKQDVVFEPAGAANPPADPGMDVPARSPAEAARNGNNPSAARGIAAANGEESLRFSAGASLTVGANIELKPPSGFVSVGAGLSVGASAGLSLGGGAGIGIGGGAGQSVGASAGIRTGAGVSGLARLSATEGAFAGLRTSVAASSARVDRAAFSSASRSGGLDTSAGADFQLGGRASLQGAAGLRSEVGGGSLNAKLSFDSF